MANIANKLLYVIPESTYGTAPTSGTMTAIRKTECNPDLAVEMATSAEKSGNRRAPYNRAAKRSTSGNIVAEFTYGDDTKLLLNGVMCGTAAAMTYTATTLSVTASTRTIADSASGIDTNKYRVGEKITFTGFTSAGNNITGIIQTISTSAIVLTSATTTLVDEAAGDSVTITSSTLRLKAGTTRRSYYIVVDQSDITTGRYRSFTGQQFNQLDFEYTPLAFNKFTIGTIGIDADLSDSAPTGLTFGTLSTVRPHNAIETEITQDGTALGIVTAYKFSIPNGITQLDVIGSATASADGGVDSTGIDVIKPTGSMTVKYTDSTAAYIAAMKAGTEFAFEVASYDLVGNGIRLGVPAATITAAPITGSDNSPMTCELTYAANHDDTLDCAAYIDFIPA